MVEKEYPIPMDNLLEALMCVWTQFNPMPLFLREGEGEETYRQYLTRYKEWRDRQVAFRILMETYLCRKEAHEQE